MTIFYKCYNLLYKISIEKLIWIAENKCDQFYWRGIQNLHERAAAKWSVLYSIPINFFAFTNEQKTLNFSSFHPFFYFIAGSKILLLIFFLKEKNVIVLWYIWQGVECNLIFYLGR